MSRRVIVSSPARRDLLNIWLYVAQDSLEAADKLAAQFEKKFELLASFPEIGQRVFDLDREGRILTVGGYVVLYYLSADEVFIIRVTHGSRDQIYPIVPRDE